MWKYLPWAAVAISRAMPVPINESSVSIQTKSKSGREASFFAHANTSSFKNARLGIPSFDPGSVLGVNLFSSLNSKGIFARPSDSSYILLDLNGIQANLSCEY